MVLLRTLQVCKCPLKNQSIMIYLYICKIRIGGRANQIAARQINKLLLTTLSTKRNTRFRMKHRNFTPAFKWCLNSLKCPNHQEKRAALFFNTALKELDIRRHMHRSVHLRDPLQLGSNRLDPREKHSRPQPVLRVPSLHQLHHHPLHT